MTERLFHRNQNASRLDDRVFTAERIAGFSGGAGVCAWLHCAAEFGKGTGCLGHILIVLCFWRSLRRSGRGPKTSVCDGHTGSAPCVARGPIGGRQGAGKTSPLRLAETEKGPTEVMSGTRVLDRSSVGPVSLRKNGVC